MKANIKRALALVALATATPAVAHVGGTHAHSFAGGVLHPVTGWDHALVALVLGLIVGRAWFAQAAATAARAAAPVAGVRLAALFLGGMTLGMLAGASAAFAGGIEQGITLSLLAAGLLLALWRDALTPALSRAAVCVLLFSGAAHGVVHAVEGGAAPAYLAGILAGTAMLHAAGMALGRLLGTQAALLRAAGALTAGAGVLVLLGA